jgi:regulator of protease activity HflC (stomatin/prohibitin superfamily)
MLRLGLAAIVIGLLVWARGETMLFGASSGSLSPGVGVLLLCFGGLVLSGLTPVAPGEARVVELFGRYGRTIRTNGLRWVNPFARRRKVSTRIRTHETALARVNDADGIPIEIAASVVWRIEDTARAMYSADDVVTFVAVQTKAAVQPRCDQLSLRWRQSRSTVAA